MPLARSVPLNCNGNLGNVLLWIGSEAMPGLACDRAPCGQGGSTLSRTGQGGLPIIVCHNDGCGLGRAARSGWVIPLPLVRSVRGQLALAARDSEGRLTTLPRRRFVSGVPELVPGAAQQGETSMASTIATLTKTSTGYKGVLTTLMIKAPIELQANARKANEKAPDFRVVASNNGFELGAAWIQQSKKTGEDYVSVSLTAPELNGVMYGNLAPAPGGKEDEYVLIWNRRN
jgi:uncharacterized protein (DUF736 family)